MLRLLLKPEGYGVDAVSSPKAVLESLGRSHYDLLLMDLNYAPDTTSGPEGLDLLDRIQKLHSRLPIVVMTAWATIPVAVEAMRRGTRDLVEKPWDNARLLATLRAQAAAHRQDLEESEEAAGNPCALWAAIMSISSGSGRASRWRTPSAKGVPTALMMSNLQAAVRWLAGAETLVGRTGQPVLAGNTSPGKYITRRAGRRARQRHLH